MKAQTLIATAAATLIGIGAFAAPAMATEPYAKPAGYVDVTYKNHGYNGGFTLYFGSPSYKYGNHNKGYGYKKQKIRYCTTGRALHKAERFGIRHARVINANKHSITVKGRKHGHRVKVKFGRHISCPVYARY
jgi:hypothetical protein